MPYSAKHLFIFFLCKCLLATTTAPRLGKKGGKYYTFFLFNINFCPFKISVSIIFFFIETLKFLLIEKRNYISPHSKCYHEICVNNNIRFFKYYFLTQNKSFAKNVIPDFVKKKMKICLIPQKFSFFFLKMFFLLWDSCIS